jgi:micrococcal nuclease
MGHGRVVVGGWMLVAGLATGCASAAGTAPVAPAPTVVAANAVVTGVVDGDTIDVRIEGRDERVRLIGIDTPETKRPDRPIECFGPEASAFTESVLPDGTAVRLERDVVGRDDYGRLLAYVHRASDGMFVNLEIVRRGFARPLEYPPNTTHAAAFLQAVRSAESDDVGLWAACS